MAEMIASWRRRAAWAGVAEAGRFGAAGASGVVAQLADEMGFATLIAAAASAGLEASIKRATGLDLPRAPIAALSAQHGVVWAGPGQWLLLARRRAGFAELLASLSGEAAVSDQSDGRAALRISGARVGDVLARGAMVDLHPTAFPVYATALTSFAHIGVQLWRAEDGPDGSVFEMLVARSMARSFWSWFSAAAAEHGCLVTIGRD
jgi:heterotetrameric sarcosine oxidase gamma subunit